MTYSIDHAPEDDVGRDISYRVQTYDQPHHLHASSQGRRVEGNYRDEQVGIEEADEGDNKGERRGNSTSELLQCCHRLEEVGWGRPKLRQLLAPRLWQPLWGRALLTPDGPRYVT